MAKHLIWPLVASIGIVLMASVAGAAEGTSPPWEAWLDRKVLPKEEARSMMQAFLKRQF